MSRATKILDEVGDGILLGQQDGEMEGRVDAFNASVSPKVQRILTGLVKDLGLQQTVKHDLKNKNWAYVYSEVFQTWDSIKYEIESVKKAHPEFRSFEA